MTLPTSHPLPETIRALRQERGLTQQQVGAALGMTKANVYRMEKGLVKVSPAKLQQLAAVFEVSVADIRTYVPPSVHTTWAAEREFLTALVDALRQQVNQAQALLSETEPVLVTFQQAVQAMADNPSDLNSEKLQEWWVNNQGQATAGSSKAALLVHQPGGEPLPLAAALSTLRALLSLWRTTGEQIR